MLTLWRRPEQRDSAFCATPAYVDALDTCMRMLSLSLSAWVGCRGPPKATGKVMVDTAYGSPIGARTTFTTCATRVLFYVIRGMGRGGAARRWRGTYPRRSDNVWWDLGCYYTIYWGEVPTHLGRLHQD